MSNQRLLKNGLAINALADFLIKCPEITQHNHGTHIEAGAIAHAFSDLEDSFHAFLDDQLPRLIKGQLKPSEIQNTLLDIGEEFRHILYHINSLKFYSYLRERKTD